eukprot:5098949-Alexandrium_andersonii.AAC.1
MSASLVGSEMCIRDSFKRCKHASSSCLRSLSGEATARPGPPEERLRRPCLLYTSDAAAICSV